jgi:hypothetical protein
MAVLSRTALKAKFENGDTPTASDFIDLIDTFLSREASESASSNSASALYIDRLFTAAGDRTLIQVGPESPPGSNGSVRLTASYASNPSGSWADVVDQFKATVSVPIRYVPFTLTKQTAVFLTADGTLGTGSIVAKLVLASAPTVALPGAYSSSSSNSVACQAVLDAGDYEARVDLSDLGGTITHMSLIGIRTNYQ